MTEKRLLVVAAHPDDIEFHMAGTMILLGRAGYELHYMTLATGSHGTLEHDRDTIVAIRGAESRAAAERLGATYHPPLVDDLEIYYEPGLLARLLVVVRDVRPTMILTHSPVDYMEDHINTSRLAVTAAFCRGMPNFKTDPPSPAYDLPVTLYHAQPHGNRTPLGELVRPSIFVDVSGVIDLKTDALACHRSQKEWLDRSQGIDSYLHTMREMNREVGTLSGRFDLAEGWRRHHPLGFGRMEDDPLCEALGPAAYRVSIEG